MIDLRSDTVTVPDSGMRKCMSEADVGDDVFGEDPTVNELQKRVARILGKEAALFVPSGQMGNQLAIKAQTAPGDELILADNAHIVHYESAAAAALSGVQLSTVETVDGYPRAEAIRTRIRAGYYWEPRSRMIALENTINRASGMIFPADEVDAVAEVARENGLALHLDGARLWNASVATGTAMETLARPFDTVTVCLSKGLGAPVGSVLAGNNPTIARAHQFRKMFGAGMRQVGFLAAAGLYAIDNNLERLSEDHSNAKRLATALASLPGIEINLESVQTNIVVFETTDTPAEILLDELSKNSIQMIKFGPQVIRATTHLGISTADIDAVISTLQKVLTPTSVSASL